MGELSPPLAKLSDFSKKLTLEERKIAALERRTALLEQIEARKTTTTTQEKQQKQNAPAVTGDFAARRAEIDAILRSARSEIGMELMKLADEWQASPATQACATVLRKFASTLQ